MNFLDARFEDGHVGENEFGLERGHVAQRIDASLRMRNRVVREEPNDLDQRIVGLHRGKKSCGELCASTGALRQAGHVDELDGGVHGALRREDLRAPVQPFVRHLDHAEVRIALPARGRIEVSLRNGLKECRLTGERQADNTELHILFSCRHQNVRQPAVSTTHGAHTKAGWLTGQVEGVIRAQRRIFLRGSSVAR